VGISVDFGSGKRVFGSIEGTQGRPVHISAGNWIKEIRLSFPQMDGIRNHERHIGECINIEESSVNGIAVSSLLSRSFKGQRNSRNILPGDSKFWYYNQRLWLPELSTPAILPYFAWYATGRLNGRNRICASPIPSFRLENY
jgi:hypothetical protein